MAFAMVFAFAPVYAFADGEGAAPATAGLTPVSKVTMGADAATADPDSEGNATVYEHDGTITLGETTFNKTYIVNGAADITVAAFDRINANELIFPTGASLTTTWRATGYKLSDQTPTVSAHTSGGQNRIAFYAERSQVVEAGFSSALFDDTTLDFFVFGCNGQSFTDKYVLLVAVSADAASTIFANNNQVQTCVSEINALPAAENLTLGDVEAVATAREHVDMLLPIGQRSISNLSKLEACELVADVLAAQAVDALIAQIPEPAQIGQDDRAAIKAARRAYEKLSDKQKALVTKLDLLEPAEAAYSEAVKGMLVKEIDHVGMRIDADEYSIIQHGFRILNGGPTVDYVYAIDAVDDFVFTYCEVAYNPGHSMTRNLAYERIINIQQTGPTSYDVPKAFASSDLDQFLVSTEQLGNLFEPGEYRVDAEKNYLLIWVDGQFGDKYAALIQTGTNPDAARAYEVRDMIEALPALDDIALGDVADVRAAQEAYASLTDAQLAFIDNSYLVAELDRAVEKADELVQPFVDDAVNSVKAAVEAVKAAESAAVDARASMMAAEYVAELKNEIAVKAAQRAEADALAAQEAAAAAQKAVADAETAVVRAEENSALLTDEQKAAIDTAKTQTAEAKTAADTTKTTADAAVVDAQAAVKSAVDAKKAAEQTAAQSTAPAVKKANPMNAKGKTVKLKAKKLKKKAKKLAAKNAFSVKGAQGKVTYKRGKIVCSKKLAKQAKKKIKVAQNGKVTVKKGLKKGTYKVKVKVKAAGNSGYKSKSKTVTLKIKVK